jgi:membrane dipeptidase
VNRRQWIVSSIAAMSPIRSEAQPGGQAIESARQAALQALKPSKRDLEHGLELHAASIVIDAYGFSPRSAVNGAEMRAAVEAGASDIELQDLQEEMNMTRCVTNAAERAEYQSAWKASGVTCVVQNAGEEGQDPLRLIKRLARFTYVTDMLRDVVEKASTPDDIVATKKRGKHCLYFSGNGVPLTQQWASVEDELRYIRIFFQLGIRIMHLTYNRRNMIGDGCAEPANAGLSDFGRAVVAEMNRVGVIPDCAHSGWQTSLEAAKLSPKPVVASHSGCVAVNRHIRCKPDEIIRALADSGGYIGICCIPGFLGRGGDIHVMLDHIDHVKKRFGAGYVAIGTDIAYLSSANAAEARKIPAHRRRTPFQSLWPEGALGGGDAAGTLHWTNWPLFTVGMVQRGYSDVEIQQILSGNVLRVAHATLPQYG